jgi:uncharacterized membrane protein
MIAVTKENRETLPEIEAAGSVVRLMQPDRVFLILGLVFGIAMLLIVPPFQVPDERNLFLRAYQISEAQFVPTWQNNVGGGMLPLSLDQVWKPFQDVRNNLNITSRRAIIDALGVPLRPDLRGYYALANCSSYSPVVFLPQAAGIALGRLLRWPPLVLMYLGRLANLSVWIGLGYLALRIAPGFGRMLLLLMLMPMSLFQAASVSPDALTNGLAFLVTAMVFHAVFADKSGHKSPIGWRWLVIFILSSSMLSLTKAAYLPLAGLILLVPARQFGGHKKFAAVLLLVAATSIIPLLLWARQTPGLDMATYRGPAFVSARQQLEFLKSHPAALLQIPFYSAQRDGWLVVMSFVGRLGWLNIQLSPVFVFLYLGVLVLACRPGVDQPPAPNPWRLIAIAILAISAATEAVLLLNDLFWTSVGAMRVDGLQGRYFIPIAPAVLMLIHGLWRALPPKFRSRRSDFRRNATAAAIILFSAAYTLIVLYYHYYVWVGYGLV